MLLKDKLQSLKDRFLENRFFPPLLTVSFTLFLLIIMSWVSHLLYRLGIQTPRPLESIGYKIGYLSYFLFSITPIFGFYLGLKLQKKLGWAAIAPILLFPIGFLLVLSSIRVDAEQSISKAIDDAVRRRTPPKVKYVEIEGECDDRRNPIQKYNYTTTKELYSVKVDEYRWVPLTSYKLGLSFEYPVEADKKVLFEYTDWGINEFDPTGIVFYWYEADIGSQDNYGNEVGQIHLASGSSTDVKVGRMEVFIHKWTEDGGKYYIHTPKEKYEVPKLMVKDMDFGTQALLYRPICFAFCEELGPGTLEPYEEGRGLIVNLPQGHRDRIESVRFTIPESFTNEDINRLLDSIELLD